MSDTLDRLRKALADRYTIEREIGSGGMATVYQAQDLKHERQVAMKVLRPELAAALGPERFLQEIKIAANLHHPHILPLYDSGDADGFLYYVMPYAEGESLRDRLDREKQLAIDDALQIAREVADALSYAHSHGVIHRDIKPENILLESGHAVVADFGIARAVDAAGGERLTETGIAIGTPTYMSPEQAGGEKDLDGRSDLYSLGCVLHEMLAGQPPFTGPTVESLVHQHLSAEPPNVTTIRPSVPGWVAAALERSLAKTPADRFNPVALFGEAISPRAAATGVRPPPGVAMRTHSRWFLPAVAGTVVVVVVAVVLLRPADAGPMTITTSNHLQVTSEAGLEFQPAISPDGSQVAYVMGPIGAPRIVVRSTIDIGTGGGVPVAQEVPGSHWYPTWTADGAVLRFWACSDRYYVSEGCSWMEVGALGGSVRTITLPRLGRYAWSRDGSRVALASPGPAAGDSIFVYDADEGEPTLLGVHVPPPRPWMPHSLAWSPDGRFIAYVNSNPHWRTSANVAASSIWLISTDDGVPVQVTEQQGLNVSPQWLPDSRHLLFVSDRDGSRGIYVVEVGPEGALDEPRSVLPSSDPHSISVSTDGRTLAYAKFTVAQNIWSVRIPRSGIVSSREATPVTTGNQRVETLSVSADGKWIAFDSDRRGAFDLYRIAVDSGTQRLVADIPGIEYSPTWSPDGTEIAYHSGSDDGGILVVSAFGGAPGRLVDLDGSEAYPVWAPDGLTVAFTHRARAWTVTRDRVGGEWGEPLQLTDFRCPGVQWAPDGESVLCQSGGEWLRVSRDGSVLSRRPRPSGFQVIYWLRFAPDGSRIYFRGTTDDGIDGLWRTPADGGSATQVVAFDDPSQTVYGHAVGPEHLYFVIAEYDSDIWVMDLEW